jgi:hypothetical protein
MSDETSDTVRLSPRAFTGGSAPLRSVAAALALMHEWLRGLRENVIDGLDPEGHWFQPARGWVESEVSQAWFRFLAEAAWLRSSRAGPADHTAGQAQPAYTQAAEEIYERVFEKIGHLADFSEHELYAIFSALGTAQPTTPPPRGSALARPDDTQEDDDEPPQAPPRAPPRSGPG